MHGAALDTSPLHHEVRGSGTPVLLIHGTGGDGASFAGAVEHLQRQHRVITYDRRGFSRSPGASHARRDYWAAHADDAARLLDELRLGPVAVCGWSGGGLVALELALRHPDRVASLLLFEPPFQASSHPHPAMLPGFLWLKLKSAFRKKRSAARTFFRVALGRDFNRLPPGVLDKLLADAEAVLKELDGGTGESITAARLAGLACPLTILVGGATSPFLVAASDRLSRLIPRAGVIRIPDAGHGMPVVQPLAFADAISRAIVEMDAMVQRSRKG